MHLGVGSFIRQILLVPSMLVSELKPLQAELSEHNAAPSFKVAVCVQLRTWLYGA